MDARLALRRAAVAVLGTAALAVADAPPAAADEGSPNIVVTTTASRSSAPVGTTFTVWVSVANLGPGDATGVLLRLHTW